MIRNFFVFITSLLLIGSALIGCTTHKDYVNTFESVRLYIPLNDIDDTLPVISEDEHVSLPVNIDEEFSKQFDDVTNIVSEHSFIKTETIDENNSKIQTSKTNETVWVPLSGKKYHKNSACSNMKSPKETSLTHAITLGYEPCKRCYK